MGNDSKVNSKKLCCVAPRHVHRHFGGQVLKKKKRAPIAKIFTELLAAVPCPSAFLLFFWHYAANFVKEINECCG